jgi:hypothetical protein
MSQQLRIPAPSGAEEEVETMSHPTTFSGFASTLREAGGEASEICGKIILIIASAEAKGSL